MTIQDQYAKEVLKKLYQSQEKMKVIDKLTNCMQKLSAKQNKEVAYLIHCIIDEEYLSSDLARQVTGWQLVENKDLFVTI